MVQIHDDVSDLLLAQPAEDMLRQRSPAEGDRGFGNEAGERVKPRSEARGEQQRGSHDQATGTPRPNNMSPKGTFLAVHQRRHKVTYDATS